MSARKKYFILFLSSFGFSAFLSWQIFFYDVFGVSSFISEQTEKDVSEQDASESLSPNGNREDIPPKIHSNFSEEKKRSEEKKNDPISILDGTRLLGKNEGQVIAVMIENHPESRAQHEGLSLASIVYETLAEGGISRFMALYSYQKLPWVGPVRSARSYYVDFAKEYGGAYVHAGGSPEALTQLSKLSRSNQLFNIEGLYWEEVPKSATGDILSFVRNTKYFAPHNLFASLNGIRNILSESEWNPPKNSSHFRFGEYEASYSPLSVDRIEINFSTPSYFVEYTYDPAIDRYVRYLAKKPHQDGDGVITPRNVIVQFTEYWVGDNQGRLKMRTSGRGMAYLFRDGFIFSGYWEKGSDGITRFFDDSGDEFRFNPGQTWIEVINSRKRVKYFTPDTF